MKLRNKKTGIVGEFYYQPDKKYHFTVAPEDPADMQIYSTIATLNEDWEDYTPSEPLIKDEKIRKAVRAWAEAVGADSAFVEKGSYDGDQFVLSDELAEIHFRINTPKEIKTYKRYTIAELCGEDE